MSEVVCKACGRDTPPEELRSSRRCKFCRAEARTKSRKVLKQHCVDYLGGACSKCGYNKCMDALSFHHIDPSHKDFELSSAPRDGETILRELDKCQLLCLNCHAEAHNWMRTEQKMEAL